MGLTAMKDIFNVILCGLLGLACTATAAIAFQVPHAKEPEPLGVLIPELKPGQKPSFIVIVTDDQGWDDIGRNNPRFVKTPNLDNFIEQGTFFDNYYVTPQCAPSRAAVLTGRHPARVGTMLVNGAWDFINSEEVTVAKVMQAGGYSTAQFGKWHNSEVLGYEPWSPMVGFQHAQSPVSAGESNMRLMRNNGAYEPAEGDIERLLMDKVLAYLDSQAQTKQPYFVYYAPHSIHLLYEKQNGERLGHQIRFSPPQYREKYHDDPKYRGTANSTLDAWAALEYLDDQLGRLFAFLQASGLSKTTYVMVMSDNGAALLPDERKQAWKRFPSMMKGDKSTVFEGGVRNFLAVQGPGVQAGVVDTSLLDITDILPTIADLASLPQDAGGHLPWDGLSFKNLLLTGSDAVPAHGNRGDSLATAQQHDRMVFILGPYCWDANLVPALGANREVLRPQPLFEYKTGAMLNVINGKELPAPKAKRVLHPGIEPCIAVRHREFKWLAGSDIVYRINGSHCETDVVPEPQASILRAAYRPAAEKWWQSVVAEPHSLEKPTFYLGLGNASVTNVLAAGAHERTPGNITLLPNGAVGFSSPGDRMCFKVKVMSPGTYDVSLFYTSTTRAVVRLYFGTYDAIVNGTARSVRAELPWQTTMRGQSIGTFPSLPVSGDKLTEACLGLMSCKSCGSNVFTNLANLRFVKRQPWENQSGSTAVPARDIDEKGTNAAKGAIQTSKIEALKMGGGSSSSSSSGGGGGRLTPSGLRLAAPLSGLSGPSLAPAQPVNVPVAQPAPSLNLSAPQYSWLKAAAAAASGQDAGRAGESTWTKLRLRNAWPDGQGDVLESMYSPYSTEDIAGCPVCQVKL